jgi:hypothetical protein
MAYTPPPAVVVSGGVISAATDNTFRTNVLELQAALPAAMSTWSSPIAAGITVGSGTVDAQYIRVGPLVYVRFRFVFGAGSAITGGISLNAPVASASPTSEALHCMIQDSGTARLPGTADVEGSSIIVAPIATSGAYAGYAAFSSTVPMTWAAGDSLIVSGWYMTA